MQFIQQSGAIFSANQQQEALQRGSEKLTNSTNKGGIRPLAAKRRSARYKSMKAASSNSKIPLKL
ncbi:hypothetical protein UNDKW_4847 [Undibacterium sp. KW1]|nr:hypothetical protein UNDKW_4847 [Undibacterium sp. KW1]